MLNLYINVALAKLACSHVVSAVSTSTHVLTLYIHTHVNDISYTAPQEQTQCNSRLELESDTVTVIAVLPPGLKVRRYATVCNTGNLLWDGMQYRY